MDDILPLTIYVVSQAQIPNLVSEFKMLEDYIKIAEQQGCKRSGSVNFELEKKILTNYNCGVIFVSKEWEPPAGSGMVEEMVGDGEMKFTQSRSRQAEDEQQLNLVEPVDMTHEDEDGNGLGQENMLSTNTAATEKKKDAKYGSGFEKSSANLKLAERKESAKSLKNVKTVEYQLDEDEDEEPTDFDQHREDQINI